MPLDTRNEWIVHAGWLRYCSLIDIFTKNDKYISVEWGDFIQG